MKLNCIAIDDEPLALQKIRRYTDKIEYLNLLEVFDNALDSLYYLKREKVDLIFLDIQMEEFTGMDLIKALKNRPYIVLTTAYENYSLQAFDLDVTDYLLKPISFERFVKAAEKVYDRFKKDLVFEAQKIAAPIQPGEKDFIFVRSDNKDQKILLDDIQYIEGLKDYLKIVTPEKNYLVLMNFKSMMDLLPDDTFVRVHRSFIINLLKVESVENHRIQIREKKIPVSNSYRLVFHKALESLKEKN